MSTRRKLLYFLLSSLGLQAQLPQASRDRDIKLDGKVYKMLRPWSEEKPKNKQCPICGTLAKGAKNPLVDTRMCECLNCSAAFFMK